MKIADNITELIGNTPLIKLKYASEFSGATVLGKCEFMNPTSSVKDRIGAYMIKSAIESGEITSETTIIEPTSGNTGIALASQCASLGLKLILTMPESMSVERRNLLKFFGAELVLTPSEKGMQGAISKAEELHALTHNSIILHQFDNIANPKIHELTTAKEILDDTENNVDVFVSAVGTGGTLTGTARGLKKQIQNIKVFAVEPKDSAILSGEEPSSHKIQGIGANFIPSILDRDIYSEVIKVSNEDALETARRLAKDEGLLVGISSGANVYAAMQVASRVEFKGKTIVTVLCDSGDRYLSTELFN